MKKLKINKMGILVLFACIVTAFSFLKSSAVSNQKNEIKTNPNTEYQITYELNGGRFEGEYPKTFKISQETAIPNPIKDGSEFLGWTINDKTDVSPMKDYKIPAMTQEDIKLTANWKSSGNMLCRGDVFNQKISSIPTDLQSITEIHFIKGIPSNISNYKNVDVSEAGDGSIIAYVSSNYSLTIASEGEIFANPDSSQMFEDFGDGVTLDKRSVLNKIIFNNFNTSKVMGMNRMFYNCYSLTEIEGLEKWNISQVTNMDRMFAGCYKLSNIDGTNKWNTNRVTNMNRMFEDCNKLSGSITIANSYNNNYSNMFRGCSTDPSAKFIVKYVSPETKEVARQMVATKGTNSNVFLYEEASTLVDGQTFKQRVEYISGFNNVKNIIFDYGIPSNISNYKNVDISLAQDRSIMAYINGDILSVVSNGEIFANPDCSKMFYRMGYHSGINQILESIMFKNFNTSKVTNMQDMFEYVGANNIKLNNWDTSQVTNMSFMFHACLSIQNLDVSDWNTSKVTNMQGLFWNTSIQSLDLSKWDTSQVIEMECIFAECRELSSLNVSNWNTSKLKSTTLAFQSCHNLTKIVGLESWDMSNLLYTSGMFEYCYNLSGEITISNLNPSLKDYVYSNMFEECATDPSAKFIVKYVSPETKEVARQMVETKKSGTTVGNVFLWEKPSTLVNGQTFNSKISAIPNFDKVVEIRFVKGTPNVNGVDVSLAQDKSIMTSMDYYTYGNVLTVACEGEIFANPDCYKMFYQFGCPYNGINKVLNKIIFNNFNTSKVTNMRGMFFVCRSLTEITGLENWDTSSVTNMEYMFSDCESLTSLENISKWDTSKVTDMSVMFASCYKFTNIKLNNWDTSKLSDINHIFYNCKSLQSLDLSNWDTSQIENMTYMFNGCTNLSGEITIKNPYMKSYTGMFTNCSTILPAKFVVNYTSDCRDVAQAMVNTANGNVLLGTEVGAISDIPNDEEASVPDTVVLTIKDGNKTTTKEIVVGEIESLNTPSKEGMIFKGYFYDIEFTNPVSERDVISENTTIYIKWEEVPQEESLEVA